MSIKKYTITWDDNQNRLTRTNDGFNLFELFGLLKISENDLLVQLSDPGSLPVETITRQVVKDEKPIKPEKE